MSSITQSQVTRDKKINDKNPCIRSWSQQRYIYPEFGVGYELIQNIRDRVTDVTSPLFPSLSTNLESQIPEFNKDLTTK